MTTTVRFETIRLDGRTFDGTAEFRTEQQRSYIEYQLWRAEIIKAPGNFRDVWLTNERSEDDIVTQILFSGRKSYVLAGCLTEQGKLWDRNEADRNATRFEQITDAGEKAAMQAFLTEFVSSFFSEGK